MTSTIANQPIRVTFFRQLKTAKPKIDQKFPLDSTLLNMVIYSPMKTLKFLDPYLKQLSDIDNVKISKCNNLQNLQYCLTNCQAGSRTILIIDEIIQQKVLDKIMRNRAKKQNKENKDGFVCWVFTPIVQQVRSKWFHSIKVQIITCEEHKIVDLLKRQDKIVRQKTGIQSMQSLRSIDESTMERRITTNVKGPEQQQKLVEQQDKQYTGDRYFDNGVPGVGTYNIYHTTRLLRPKQTSYYFQGRYDCIRRWYFDSQKYRAPGPGAYSINEQRRHIRTFNMDGTVGHLPLFEINTNPGVGRYNLSN